MKEITTKKLMDTIIEGIRNRKGQRIEIGRATSSKREYITEDAETKKKILQSENGKKQ